MPCPSPAPPPATGGRTIIPGVTSLGGAAGEADATGAGSGLGSMVDMSGSSASPGGAADPFSVTTGASMNGGNGVLGTSASSMAGIGGSSTGSTSALAQRRQSRVAGNSSGSYKVNTGLAGALILMAALVL